MKLKPIQRHHIINKIIIITNFSIFKTIMYVVLGPRGCCESLLSGPKMGDSYRCR